MDEVTRPLQELVQELPPDLRAEVRDFVEFLLSKRGQRPGQTLRQDWAGALREYRQRYSAFELQRLSIDWRND